MYWGTWTDKHRTGSAPPWDMSAAAQVESQVGKNMSLIEFGTPMTYGDGQQPFTFPSNEFNKIRSHGSIPFFSWSTHAMRNYSHPDFTLAAIINGSKDTLIRQWATSAKNWRSPFFLRFNWEMNGGWFPWGERYGSNKAGEYVAAWRHVHDIFKSVGATNVTWVWCPTADPWRTLQPLAGLYPGDAYVDWTCMDVYNMNAPWLRWAQVGRSTYDEIMRIAPSKPMVIAETGSTESGGSKAAWITDMFASLPSFPKIRGLIWFDSLEGGSSAYNDYNLDSSTSAINAFATAAQSPSLVDNQYGRITASPIAPPS
jgi:beta-mannanase